MDIDENEDRDQKMDRETDMHGNLPTNGQVDRESTAHIDGKEKKDGETSTDEKAEVRQASGMMPPAPKPKGFPPPPPKFPGKNGASVAASTEARARPSMTGEISTLLLPDSLLGPQLPSSCLHLTVSGVGLFVSF